MGNIAIYATKGFEYILILSFLAVFTVLYLYVSSRRFKTLRSGRAPGLGSLVEWFEIPANLLFHQGHAWAVADPEDPSLLRVGLDDFAQRMVGRIDNVATSGAGQHLRQGEKGWSLFAGNKVIDMLAPVSGNIVEVNRVLQSSTGIVNSDPYGDGWVYKVRPENLARERRNLLSGSMAAKWMETVMEKLRLKMGAELGLVLQDGGVPVSGMAKMIDKSNWDRLVREFFLT